MPALDFATSLNPVLSELYRDLAQPGRAGGITAAICSAAPGEGVTTIVYNLMRRLAADPAAGRRICAIDANHAHPELNRLFQLPGRPGLTDHVLGAASLDEIIHPTELSPFVSLIPFNPNIEGSAAVQISTQLPRMLEQLKKRFDLILIDTAPILSDNRVQLDPQHIDAFYLVIKAQSTQREIVQKALEDLRAKNATIKGVILNQRQLLIPKVLY